MARRWEQIFHFLLSLSVLLELYHFRHIITSVNPFYGTEIESFLPIDETDIKSRRNKNLDPRADFSACLLIKDENTILPEWIAYHYHVVQLRDLVICRDPVSVSSPLEIVSRWNGTDKMGMNIFVWEDDVYMPEHQRGRPPLSSTPPFLSALYYERQVNCYKECSRFLRNRNRTWTMFIDADEFLTYNVITDDEKAYRKLNPSDPESLYVLKPNVGINFDTFRVTFSSRIDPITKQNMIARTRLPKHLVDKALGQFILDESNNVPWNLSGCIVLPRLSFGAEEENDMELLNRSIPTGFEAKNFATLRYFRNAGKDDIYNNRAGKTLADVSRIRGGSRVRNPHSVFAECGGTGAAYVMSTTSLFRVNHYTLPRPYRGENSSQYQERAVFNREKIYEIQPWLIDFVHAMGLKKAHELLEGAGKFGKWTYELYDFEKPGYEPPALPRAESCCPKHCKNATLNTRIGGGNTCRDRINYMIDTWNLNLTAACTHVSNQYPKQCGSCDPEKCL